jgi:eukaryotic-like serine/threonine-protein kinase
VAQQLLAALASAHNAGVLHRDVKPSNVLLGSDGRAVLTDFGIATFQGDPRLTQTGMVMGSPGYTAPERIRGGPATPASDLWSLGATLYTAVEGHGPFEKRGGAITTMSAITHEDPPPCPAAGPLGGIILALLRRDPAGRPDAQTAARLISRLLPLLPEERVPDGVPIASPSPETSAPAPVAASAVGATVAAAPAAVGTAGPAEAAPTRNSRDGMAAAQAGPGDVTGLVDGPHPDPGTRPQEYPPRTTASVPASRQRFWLITAVVAVVLAGCVVLGVVLATQSPAAPRKAASSTTPRTISQPDNPALAALNQLQTVPPPNYTAFSQSPAQIGTAAGFSIDTAPGWNIARENGLVWADQGPNAQLDIELTPHKYLDMLREASHIKSEALLEGHLPGYQEIIPPTRAEIRGTPGAIWEFSYLNSSGVELRAEDMLFIKNGQSYALYLVANALDWASSQSAFDQQLSTFQSITTS